jgi:UDP-glucose 4-epimerase
MKVAVTGGAGFIGSNLCQDLCKVCDVVVIDDFSTGKAENLDALDVECLVGSVTNLNFLRNIFEDVDFVFHQAAITSVQRSIENPIETNEVNIGGTLNVLTASRDCDVKKVIYASSAAVYGNNPQTPKREDMIPDPKSPYAASKITGEYYCRIFSELYGLKTVCLRYFNVYGPKQDPKSEYSAVIPKFITSIFCDQNPVIYGDGNQTRDFVFVKDVVKANVLAMKKDIEGIFNVACGQKININEIADKITSILGTKLDPVYEKSRPGDVKESLADISLAMESLGYRPEYSLEDGLKETIEWYKNSI